MPWDSDIDVQMSVSTVHYLASYYNMTIHRYQARDYMLEINPKYTDGSFEDKLNVIDGRWIDIQTGLFIDITAIRPKKGVKGVVVSKDKQEAKIKDLFPLRDSLFEGHSVKVPYNYAKMLSEDYGNKALTKTEFAGHKFNATSMEWEKLE
ncbi:MAG: mannosyltransferase [Ramalina farinacea]|uniref:Mannosyltransferase n=1 Tax=Ramalina farinacea TaxID=258253 RepID=A0AA43QPG7_9LECA|nr:mannosyltransferase [Ramalina farinacea]